MPQPRFAVPAVTALVLPLALTLSTTVAGQDAKPDPDSPTDAIVAHLTSTAFPTDQGWKTEQDAARLPPGTVMLWKRREDNLVVTLNDRTGMVSSPEALLDATKLTFEQAEESGMLDLLHFRPVVQGWVGDGSWSYTRGENGKVILFVSRTIAGPDSLLMLQASRQLPEGTTQDEALAEAEAEAWNTYGAALDHFVTASLWIDLDQEPGRPAPGSLDIHDQGLQLPELKGWKADDTTASDAVSGWSSADGEWQARLRVAYHPRTDFDTEVEQLRAGLEDPSRLKSDDASAEFRGILGAGEERRCVATKVLRVDHLSYRLDISAVAPDNKGSAKRLGTRLGKLAAGFALLEQ